MQLSSLCDIISKELVYNLIFCKKAQHLFSLPTDLCRRYICISGKNIAINLHLTRLSVTICQEICISLEKASLHVYFFFPYSKVKERFQF